ncbi:S-adenosyl-L-methionine-dependent methyltransferase [Vararia minispora EC-137]|uniref:S-adenosyl-L-methionine-dependent methyltransferase n=1 Tax=Vararia minispora EC-137 TaxID=1314806 RepID=A0ACB8QU32_9AGAM|nr:S-adenosyl-L-methionine-dependent methyltransferase [Vararia minispora EC-137]
MSRIVHQVAQAGFGTGTNELYDRARPSYRPEALEHIRKAASKQDPVDIVEIGAGTGIFTRALLAHPAWATSIASLTAIEPSEGMRAQFARTVTDSRVTVREGTFDSTGAPDASADIVVIAQAFHWCPDYNAAAEEFARVLRPRGILVLIWNLEDREGAAWVAQLREIYEARENGTPQFRLGLWRAVFDTPNYKSSFVDTQEEIFAYTLEGSLEIVTDRVQSKSYITMLEQNEKAKVIEQIREIIERGDGKKWIDEGKGIFEYPYKTLVVIAKRT